MLTDGELTLRHLRELGPRRILVTNRSPEKARTVAAGCGGEATPWEHLDDALVEADSRVLELNLRHATRRISAHRPSRCRSGGRRPDR